MMRNKRRLIPIIAFVHCVATWIFFGLAWRQSWARFDTGALPTRSEQILSSLSEILLFPTGALSQQNYLRWLGALGPLLIILNSFLWSIVLYGAGALLLKMKNRGKHPLPASLSLLCLAALMSVGISASAQKTTFSDMPRSHWVYKGYDLLVKAKIAGYPTSCFGPRTKPPTLTRYEFAVAVKRTFDTFALERKLTQEQRRLIPILKRMAKEFAPEIEQLSPPKKKRHSGV